LGTQKTHLSRVEWIPAKNKIEEKHVDVYFNIEYGLALNIEQNT
jgi:hypothetical protein